MALTRYIGLLALLPLTPIRQQQAAQQPTFHASTHLVQINVVVRDRDGRPVRDLTKDDFTILDRGKVKAIGVFSAEASNAAAAEKTAPLAQNTFSDEAKYHGDSPNGVTIILLDNLNTLSSTSPQPYQNTPYWLEALALPRAKQHLIEFLKQLDSNQRIAIYGLTEKLHVLCDFTCSRDQLLAVVTKFDATSMSRGETVNAGDFDTEDQLGMPGGAVDAKLEEELRTMVALNNRARAQTTMAALDAIAAHVADLPGRKSLLWLTANLPFSGEVLARILSRGNIVAYPVDARGLLPRAPAENIKGVQDEDAVIGEVAGPSSYSQPTGIDTMQRLAEQTGGRAFVNSNDLTGAIRQAIGDSEVTYTLGFYLDPGALDDRFHELKVQVRRAGLSVQQPRGYFALKDTSTTDDDRHRSFAAAVKSPLEYSAIPLQVKVDRVDQPKPNSLQLVASLGIKTLQLAEDAGARTGAVDIYVIEQDAAGNVLHQAANRVRLKLSEQQYQTYLQSGIGFRQLVQPAAGTTTLRVLVQDQSTSVVGSVVIPLAKVK